jgi:small subunit ribosomal protein S20
MATHKSALREHRKSLKRRATNRARRSVMRTAVKKLRGAIAAGDASRAKALLVPTLVTVDRAASRKVCHPNAAARTKSRLAAAVARLSAGPAA